MNIGFPAFDPSTFYTFNLQPIPVQQKSQEEKETLIFILDQWKKPPERKHFNSNQETRNKIAQTILIAYENESTELDLSRADLSTLPECLHLLPWLKKINLAYNHLSELPQGFAKLENLEELNLSSNGFSSFPELIANYKKLRTLEFAFNKHGQHLKIPPFISELTQLQILNFNHSYINSIPDSFSKLTNLKRLDLGYNVSTNIYNLALLTSLEVLHLYWDHSISLKFFENFPALRELCWSIPQWNKSPLNHPEDFPALEKLEVIVIEQSLQVPNLSKVKNLRSLTLKNNKLTNVSFISELKNLEFLDLSYNQLTQLPPGIANLTSLHHLDLSQNQLESLPTNLGCCSPLKTLLVQSNKLKALPASIAESKTLEVLDACNNSLSTLGVDDFTGKLPNITRLILHHNVLSTLPKNIGNLKKLQALGVGDNRLSELDSTIENARSLKELYIWRNRLTSLPDTLTKLPLIALLVYENQLTHLGKFIGELKSLKSLQLNDNQLETVPEEINSLIENKSLAFSISNNPIKMLPLSTFRLLFRLSQLSNSSLLKLQITDRSEECIEEQLLKWIQSSNNESYITPANHIYDVYINKRPKLFIGQITSLPECISKLNHIKHLEIKSSIKVLPPFIGNFHNLTHLVLHTEATELPESFTNLVNLEELDLVYSPLATLPDWFRNFGPKVEISASTRVHARLRELGFSVNKRLNWSKADRVEQEKKSKVTKAAAPSIEKITDRKIAHDMKLLNDWLNKHWFEKPKIMVMLAKAFEKGQGKMEFEIDLPNESVPTIKGIGELVYQAFIDYFHFVPPKNAPNSDWAKFLRQYSKAGESPRGTLDEVICRDLAYTITLRKCSEFVNWANSVKSWNDLKQEGPVTQIPLILLAPDGDGIHLDLMTATFKGAKIVEVSNYNPNRFPGVLPGNFQQDSTVSPLDVEALMRKIETQRDILPKVALFTRQTPPKVDDDDDDDDDEVEEEKQSPITGQKRKFSEYSNVMKDDGDSDELQEGDDNLVLVAPKQERAKAGMTANGKKRAAEITDYAKQFSRLEDQVKVDWKGGAGGEIPLTHTKSISTPAKLSGSFWFDTTLQDLADIIKTTKLAKAAKIAFGGKVNEFLPVLEQMLQNVPQQERYFWTPSLKKYQGVKVNQVLSLRDNHLNAILAAKMGLGKTYIGFEIIAQALAASPHSSNLIFVPKSLLVQTQEVYQRLASDFLLHVITLMPKDNDLFFTTLARFKEPKFTDNKHRFLETLKILSLLKDPREGKFIFYDAQFKRRAVEFVREELGRLGPEKTASVEGRYPYKVEDLLNIDLKKSVDPLDICKMSYLQFLGALIYEPSVQNKEPPAVDLKALYERLKDLSIPLVCVQSSKGWTQANANFRTYLQQQKPFIIVSTSLFDKSALQKSDAAFTKNDFAHVKSVIVDEAHKLNNSTTLNHNNSKELLKLMPPDTHITFLTGTPITNDIKDLWNLFTLCNPANDGLFDEISYNTLQLSLSQFTDRLFQEKGDTQFARQSFNLFCMLRSCVKKMCLPLAMEEEAVKTEWDNKVPTIKLLDIDCQNLMPQSSVHEINQEYNLFATSGGAASRMFKINFLFHNKILHDQIEFLGKKEDENEIDENILQEFKSQIAQNLEEAIKHSPLLQALHRDADLQQVIHEKKKALLFFKYKVDGEILKTYMETRFGQSVKTMLYNGEVKDDNKKVIIEEFKGSDNSQSKILLLSIQCGAVGLDFPLVNEAYDFTYSFVPAETEQARYRIARVGHAGIKVIRSLNFGTVFEDHLTIIKEVKEALTNFLFCPNEERGQLEKLFVDYIKAKCQHELLLKHKDHRKAKEEMARIILPKLENIFRRDEDLMEIDII